MREDISAQRQGTTTHIVQQDNVVFELIESLESSQGRAMASRGGQRLAASKRKQRSSGLNTKTVLLSVLATAPGAMAQNCISLSGSTQCPAFSASSISTDSALVGFLCVLLSYRNLLDFLLTVSMQSFSPVRLQHINLRRAIKRVRVYKLRPAEVCNYPCNPYDRGSNATCRYQTLLGCGNINLTNTTNLYARYTTSVICNAIIQNSITPCGLSGAASQPVCANTCVSLPHQLILLHVLTINRPRMQRLRQSSLPTITSARTRVPMPTRKYERTSLIALYQQSH